MKNHKITLSATAFCMAFCLCATMEAEPCERRETKFNEGWRFAIGHAADRKKDFGAGIEYFNYLTKARSIHNEGPYTDKFDAQAWTPVRLPHDWVLQLPFDSVASHSHGYRAVGYKYPQNSVGWYRKEFEVAASDEGKHVVMQFDGIFRNATIWVNGFYMGTEPSGYATQVYDVSDYLIYGGKNVVAVRADASLEEGWFYEGAGIYRDVWMKVMDMVHVAPFGTFVYSSLSDNYTKALMTVETEVENSSLKPVTCLVESQLIDDAGQVVAQFPSSSVTLRAKEKGTTKVNVNIDNPHLWSCDDPYLYSVRTQITVDGKMVDVTQTTTGIREVRFTADEGFLLNGRQLKLKGVNMHQDHAGVGAAIPDALQAYRIRRLKSLGCNAYRASHNPMTPAMLDVCDREGILVIDENRLMGVNEEHLRLLERMIRRDRNHPSVMLWSDGNEEWGLENNEQGVRVAASMREYTHLLDPTRMVTVANAGGATMIKSLEVVGYNYIVQNDVENRRKAYPHRIIVGTEETTGCGSRGTYFVDPTGASMPSLNRTDTDYENKIERGWKFYNSTPWTAGVFFWTGFDYRGESNPLSYPAVGSQFGILDYCGFEKDEAYYLRSWWTDEPVLHIFPHWNLAGHEGETISLWAYSNCDEVELVVNGKNLGRKPMPRDGHLTWEAVYRPGTVKAIGYRKGRRVMQQVMRTTGAPATIKLEADRTQIKADNEDVAVLSVRVADKKGLLVPTANNVISITLEGEGRILGVGNGDPAFKGAEHPDQLECHTFTVPLYNGAAQILIQSSASPSTLKVTCQSDGLTTAAVAVDAQ